MRGILLESAYTVHPQVLGMASFFQEGSLYLLQASVEMHTQISR